MGLTSGPAILFRKSTDDMTIETEHNLLMARNVLGCMATLQWQLWDEAHAQAAVLVAQLGAGMATGLQLVIARLGALNCLVLRVIRMAEPA